MKKKIVILLIISMALFLVSCDTTEKSTQPELLKHDNAVSAYNEHEELFKRSIEELDKLKSEDNNIDPNLIIKLGELSEDEELDYNEVQFEGVSTTEKKEIISDEYNEAENTHYQRYKDIEGLYATYFIYGSEHFVQIENSILSQLFDETDVNSIYYGSGTIFFYLYEKDHTTDIEISGLLYEKSGEPDIPSGDLAETQETENGWLYQSEYTKEYIEKISDKFYYFNNVGHDPV